MFRSITEETSFRCVRVEIEVIMESGSMSMSKLYGEIMQIGDFWKDIFIEFVELPVEIFSTEAGSKVTCDYSIRVEHGYNIEDEGASKCGGDGIFREKESN